MADPDQKVALVTGGSSGIGRATAARLVRAGFHVLICARGEERLEQAVQELSSESASVVGQVADLARREDAKTVIDRTLDEFGRLNALVNAHGIIGNGFYALDEIPPEEWRAVLDVNLMAPIALTTLAIPALRESKGAVVNVSSINAIQAEPFVAPYGVSKAGLAAFTKYAAGELASYGIRVNAVLPGWVMTPMAEPFLEEADVMGKVIDTNMMGRAADPDELAAVIEFLLSDDASFVTGECMVADGGHWVQLAPLRERK